MITIGTRGSALALWQARHVEELLRSRTGESCRIQIIKTQGDAVRHLPLEKLEGKGFFTKELEESLLSGEIDIAVHSLKDLPTSSLAELVIAAIPGREDPSEALLVNPAAFDAAAPVLPLKIGAVVGTSSNRRRAQLLAHRPDLEVAALRGNVPTRVEKVKRGDFGAILLANAGLKRLALALDELRIQLLDPEDWVPAPGQGALALQIRSTDTRTRDVVAQIHDAGVAAVVQAERSVLARLEGGCHMPLGVYGRWNGDRFRLTAVLGLESRADERARQPWPIYRLTLEGSDPEELAGKIYDGLAPQRVAMQSAEVRAIEAPTPANLTGKSVVVTRAADRSAELIQRLESLGMQVISYPTVQQVPLLEPHQLREALGRLGAGDWILFASAAAVTHFMNCIRTEGLGLPANIRIGAIGPATATTAAGFGMHITLMPDEATSEAFVAAFVRTWLRPGGSYRVLLPTARDGRTVIEQALRREGCEVERLNVYATVLPTGFEPPDLSHSRVDYVLFMSPSAAENFLRLGDWPEGAESITIGPTTSARVRELGLPVHREAKDHTAEGIVQALLRS